MANHIDLIGKTIYVMRGNLFESCQVENRRAWKNHMHITCTTW
jgi:hypothetical protein